MRDVIFEAESLPAETYWSSSSPGLNGPHVLYDQRTVHAIDITHGGGSGTITITPYTSISGDTWVSNGTVLDGFLVTDGPDGDGKTAIPLSLIPGDLIKFKIVIGVATTVTSMSFVQK